MQFLQYFPRVRIEVQAQPITRTILKVTMKIEAKFKWSDRWNKAYIVVIYYLVQRITGFW